MDRMKLLLQVDSTARGLTMREGWNRMVTEGVLLPDLITLQPDTVKAAHEGLTCLDISMWWSQTGVMCPLSRGSRPCILGRPTFFSTRPCESGNTLAHVLCK